MFDQMTLPGIDSAISSPESESGHMPCDRPGGRMTALSGPALAPASLSVPPASNPACPTIATSGPSGSTSSASAILTLSLVSRLKARSATAGSTLFKLTWKESVTPSRRSVSLLRASVRRISDNDCGSWPTPQATDMTGGGMAARAMGETRHGSNLRDFAMLSGWPTPNAGPQNDTDTNWPALRAACKEKHINGNGFGLTLGMASTLASWPTPRREDSESTGAHRGVPDTLHSATQLAGWATPMAGTPAQNGNNAAGNNDYSRSVVALASWHTPVVRDHRNSGGNGTNPRDLPRQAHQAYWQTPATDSFRSRGGDRKDEMGLDQQARTIPMPVMRVDRYGRPVSGFDAATTAGGQLNPAHSRWLMGLPAEWDACAPTGMRFARRLPKSS